MAAPQIATSKTCTLRGTPVAFMRSARHSATRRPTLVVRANVARYLSEALQQVFSPLRDETNVPWDSISQPFVGKIKHHEEVERMEILASQVQAAIFELERSIDELPEGDVPVTATASATANTTGTGEPAAQSYVAEAIDRVFNHNFKGDMTEPSKYFGGGYHARGRTQREVRREIDRLRRFQQVIETAVEKAEVKAK